MADIKEFGTTIQQDTSKALETVTAKVSNADSSSSSGAPMISVESIKHGLSKIASSMSEAANAVAKEFEREETQSDASSSSLLVSPLNEKLDLNDAKEFAAWLETFDMESKQSEIATLLATNSAIYTLHQQLVPGELSSDEFWGRYFYKTELAAKKEEKRLQLLERSKIISSKLSEPEFSWDDDEEDATQETPKQEEEEKVEPLLKSHATAPSSAVVESIAVENNSRDSVNMEKEKEESTLGVAEEEKEEKREKIQKNDESAPSASTESANEPDTKETSPKGEKGEEENESKKEEAKGEEEEDVFDWN